MKNITQLVVEGVKRVKAVSITPNGSSVVIGGRNAQGKTSVIDSIEMALGGKKTIPSRPIHDGEDTARIVVRMDGLIVTRTFTEKGSYLKVTTEDGATYPGAQAMLDSLVGRLSLDPHAFTQLSPKDQGETLRKLTGIDTTELESERKQKYEARTESNRILNNVNAQLSGMVKHDDVPQEEVSVSSLARDLEKANAKNSRINGLNARIDSNHEQMKVVQAKIDELVATSVLIEQDIVETEAEIKSIGEPADTETIRSSIESAEETNRKVRENAKYQTTVAALTARQEASDVLTKEIAALDQQKADMIAAAEYPIEGLGVDDDGIVTYNGIPFDQASGAEQLRISAAIGLALNPKMGVLLVRDASLLDDDSMRALLDFADEKGAQVWMERVGDGDECTVIIEDGMVLGADESE